MKKPRALLLVAALVAGGAAGHERDENIEIVRVIAPLTLDPTAEGSNVQTALDDEIDEQRRLTLADYLRANLASVFVNEAQSNPLQPDLQYRGFIASPLLGLPQGLAVYQDGVRVNEPFGDTVNWALIPDSAISEALLVPGSNPLFGLNTLGGGGRGSYQGRSLTSRHERDALGWLVRAPGVHRRDGRERPE